MFANISLVITGLKALSAAAAAFQAAKKTQPSPTDEMQKIQNGLAEAEAALNALIQAL